MSVPISHCKAISTVSVLISHYKDISAVSVPISHCKVISTVSVPISHCKVIRTVSVLISPCITMQPYHHAALSSRTPIITHINHHAHLSSRTPLFLLPASILRLSTTSDQFTCSSLTVTNTSNHLATFHKILLCCLLSLFGSPSISVSAVQIYRAAIYSNKVSSTFK